MTSGQIQYFPEVFEVPDAEAAKSIILTNEGPGADTATRWELETPYVTALIAEHLKPQPGMLILDYGCGIGRLARPLIDVEWLGIVALAETDDLSCRDTVIPKRIELLARMKVFEVHLPTSQTARV